MDRLDTEGKTENNCVRGLQGNVGWVIGVRRAQTPMHGEHMNKTELVGFVADRCNMTKADAGRAVEAVFEGIGSSLSSGDKVALAGFGTFNVKERAARTGRNPQTGAAIEIGARKVASFSPGSGLKDQVNN